MATLQRYFPGNVNPDHYSPPIVGTDYMPSMAEFLDFEAVVSRSSSSTRVLFKFENGIQAKIIGTGLKFDSNGDAIAGEVTEVQVLTATGKLIEKISGFAVAAKTFQTYLDDSWSMQQWLLRGNDKLNGGDGGDDLYGYAGNDVLKGGAGDDFFVGGEGKDTYDGGAGWDQLSFDDSFLSKAAKKGVTIDATAHKATDPYGNVESFSSIESFRGTKFVDTLKGSTADEQFMGLAGADKIDGGGGFDEVRYHRDVNRGGKNGVTVDLTKGYAIDGFKTKDTLTSIEAARGTDFADKLIGNSVKNSLRGDGGKDQIYGKLGNDKLQGGGGKDAFFFDTKLNGSSNVDTITDFSVTDDTVYLAKAIFTKIAGTGAMSSDQFYASTSGKAHDADDRITYNKQTGDLFYDSDGAGKAAAVRFAIVEDGLKLTSTDFFLY
ncbi:calcium-binding protein [Rhizobium sp. ZW T2_16]|uniref:calcium-binding protein n=1 Tax=Rhizobium sp. ZW T2_16 TaxID=3378083 RepID=UPI003851B5F8